MLRTYECEQALANAYKESLNVFSLSLELQRGFEEIPEQILHHDAQTEGEELGALFLLDSESISEVWNGKFRIVWLQDSWQWHTFPTSYHKCDRTLGGLVLFFRQSLSLHWCIFLISDHFCVIFVFLFVYWGMTNNWLFPVCDLHSTLFITAMHDVANCHLPTKLSWLGCA